LKKLTWLLRFILKAAIFFTLFAFALNNQEDVVVRFFFGTTWQAPLVLVVLAAFVAGTVLGVAGMIPRLWRLRRHHSVNSTTPKDSPPTASTSASDSIHGI
jgi:lipopolysaccharide assembly protein A